MTNEEKLKGLPVKRFAMALAALTAHYMPFDPTDTVIYSGPEDLAQEGYLTIEEALEAWIKWLKEEVHE